MPCLTFQAPATRRNSPTGGGLRRMYLQNDPLTCHGIAVVMGNWDMNESTAHFHDADKFVNFFEKHTHAPVLLWGEDPDSSNDNYLFYFP